MKSNIPELLVGPPGVGKTATTMAKYDYTELVLLSSYWEEHLSGIPYREGNKERRTIPYFVERIQEQVNIGKKKICLFFDEMDKSRREVADTMLTLITDRERFGIPSFVDIVAAANPPEYGGGDGISSAMLSRFSIIDYEIDVENWLTFMRKKYQEKYGKIYDKFEEGILSKKLNTFEMVGDGFNQRISCPRTYDMVFAVLDSDNYVKKVQGLLTTNSSSFILSLLQDNKEFENLNKKVQDLARSIGRSVFNKKPLRL